MAASTPIVLAAGAIAIGHEVLVENRGAGELVLVGVSVALAAVAAAALDGVVPGLGTGTAALMLTTIALAYLPALGDALLKDRGR